MLRRLIPLIMSVVLSLASVGLAVARTQSGLSWQVTLCQGTDTVDVGIDANGNPVRPLHHCAQCLTGVALGLPPADQPMPFVQRLVLPQPPMAAPVSPPLPRLPPRAQGPPATV